MRSLDITKEECQFLADTFWSGSAPDYFVEVESMGSFCYLDAYYLGEARHAFYWACSIVCVSVFLFERIDA